MLGVQTISNSAFSIITAALRRIPPSSLRGRSWLTRFPGADDRDGVRKYLKTGLGRAFAKRHFY